MNRQQRRAHRPTGTPIRDLCPDCDAETTIVEIAPGLHVIAVAHDDTCPTFNSMKK